MSLYLQGPTVIQAYHKYQTNHNYPYLEDIFIRYLQYLTNLCNYLRVCNQHTHYCSELQITNGCEYPGGRGGVFCFMLLQMLLIEPFVSSFCFAHISVF